MRHIENWDDIQEMQSGDFNTPVPGGYIAMILRVEDKEDKEYLAIEWDFVSGEYQGANQETFDRAGFWPTTLRRSYKDSALGFFKAFKTAVEASNRGYTFSSRDVQGLVGKRMGVVLGEEEYRKNNGEIGQRLYVYQVRSVKAIQEGDFKVPDLKKLSGQQNTPGRRSAYNVPFSDISDDDGNVPF